MATKTTLIVDVGDVLITTRRGAHYRRLADLTGLPASEIAVRIEGAQLPLLFERGTLGIDSFVAKLRSCLATPQLGERDVRDAWNCVIGSPVPALVTVIGGVAHRRKVVFASNTNPFHWPVVRHRLGEVGLSAPAVLSYEVGFVKPESGFFGALLQYSDHPPAAVLVDDRAANINAARVHGIDGWIHDDIDVTINRIQMMFVA
jgi:glucose-1-phosphatase